MTITLTQLSPDDAGEITRLLQDEDVGINLLRLPMPYKNEYAVSWIEDNRIFEHENGFKKNYAIRDVEGKLLGVIGFHFGEGDAKESCEFGYWLGKKYWGKGIMTSAVQQICVIGKDLHHLKTLYADVFTRNPASQKVLLKSGFTQTDIPSQKTRIDGEVVGCLRFVKNLELS